MSQASIFTETEGDAYYRRNAAALTVESERAKTDRVLAAMRELKLAPRTVLEIGCSTGWRLELIRQEFGANCWGIEPSEQAVKAGREAYPLVRLLQATASEQDMLHCFDLVIYGFCLYLADRNDLFPIAAKGDHALVEGGHLIIEDFLPLVPHRRPYLHDPRITTYKMDYAGLWLGNPAYQVVTTQQHGYGQERTAVTVLHKDTGAAYPLVP